MNTEVRKNAKKDFQDFFKLTNNADFGEKSEKYEKTKISSL